MTILTNTRTINVLLIAFLIIFCVAVGIQHIDNIKGFFVHDVKVEGKGSKTEVSNKSESLNKNKEGNASVNQSVPASVELAENIQNKDIEEFFINYRMERDRVRGQQVELLQKIISDPSSDTQMKKDAQKKLIELTENMEKEMQLESLIKAKGYRETALFIQPGSATVIIKKDGDLTEEDAAKVADIVSKVTGFDLSDIVVVPK
ncbi:MAG: SpoIIIAH-like family protein [Clostridia bacterium]|nr:SpoIIIAH-like family protein [Clostridia bacterium]